MSRRISNVLLGLIAVAAFGITGCGGGDGGGSTPGPTTGSLFINNTSVKTVTAVYISPTSSGSWGSNQITSSILPGSSRTIVNIPVGSYDIKYVSSDGVTLISSTTLVVSAGNTSTRTLVKVASKPVSGETSGTEEITSEGISNATTSVGGVQDFITSSELGDAK